MSHTHTSHTRTHHTNCIAQGLPRETKNTLGLAWMDVSTGMCVCVCACMCLCVYVCVRVCVVVVCMCVSARMCVYCL